MFEPRAIISLVGGSCPRTEPWDRQVAVAKRMLPVKFEVSHSSGSARFDDEKPGNGPKYLISEKPHRDAIPAAKSRLREIHLRKLLRTEVLDPPSYFCVSDDSERSSRGAQDSPNVPTFSNLTDFPRGECHEWRIFLISLKTIHLFRLLPSMEFFHSAH